MEKNKEKFLKLVDRHDPSTMKDVQWRIRNRWWLRPYQSVALFFLVLKDKFSILNLLTYSTALTTILAFTGLFTLTDNKTFFWVFAGSCVITLLSIVAFIVSLFKTDSE